MAERDAREQFARAVDEGATHSDDVEFGAELDIVTELRRAGRVEVSDHQTRHNVAVRIAGRMTPSSEDTSGASPRTPRTPRRRYLQPALVAAFCLFMGFGGLAVLLSEGALPGDGLYPLKRARESTVLSLTFDQQEQAVQRLSYASDRLDELSMLAGHETEAEGRATDYSAGFADFSAAAQGASQSLTHLAVRTSGDQLATLRAWSTHASERLDELKSALPAGATQQRAATVALVDRIEHRAHTLHARFDCYRITSGTSDELGALPATGNCIPPAQPNDPEPDHPEPAPPQNKRDDSPSAPRQSDTTEPTPDETLTKRVSVTDESRVPDPVQFERITPAPVSDPPERPRLPDDADASEHSDGLVPDLVNGILNVRLS